MECGLKKRRASSAIRMRASSMIQNTQRKRIGFPHRIEFYGETSDRRSLLSGIRFSDSDHFRAEGNEEGVHIS
jgi:hypothetical protein